MYCSLHFGVEVLYAHADPVEPDLLQPVESLMRHGSWINLDGIIPLDVVSEPEIGTDMCNQVLKLIGLQKRGGASTEVQLYNPPVIVE